MTMWRSESQILPQVCSRTKIIKFIFKIFVNDNKNDFISDTVSSTYKRGTVNGFPVAPPRLSKDQQEFDEALGTLARRRKYTLDNSSSRYSSSLTMNGDPGRIYEGSPQDTTASIMGDLTPKPPARRLKKTEIILSNYWNFFSIDFFSTAQNSNMK